MTYAPHAPRGSLSRPPGTWHPGADMRPGVDMRLLGERGTKIMKFALPLGLGLLYGYWAAANIRDGGTITGWNLFFGFMTALVFMLALTAMRALAARLPRGVRALAWAAFSGMALGFLVSTTDTSVVRSVVMGVALAVGVFVSVLYRVQTRRTPGAVGAGEPRYPVAAGEDALRTEAYTEESFTTHRVTGRALTSGTTATSPTASTSPTAAATGTAVRSAPPDSAIRPRRRRGGRVRMLMRTVKLARSIRRHH